jgi:hypothetical protein
VEKWKTGFTVEIASFIFPQAVWKTLWKTRRLWKKLTTRRVFHQFPQGIFSTACGNVENFV